MNDCLSHIKINGFNHRSLTENDFYLVCAFEKITVFDADVPTSFYFTCDGRAFIVIKKSLRGLKRLFSMFHELAHHFLHGGRDFNTQTYFFGMLETKNEVEADAAALVSIVPLIALNSFDFLEDHPSRYGLKLYKDRQKLYFLYGV